MKVIQGKVIRFFVSFLFILSILMCTIALGQPISIVSDNRPKAEIVIAIDASKQVHDAAIFLQEYIEKSTKAKLRITTMHNRNINSIHIGRTPLSAEIVIKSRNPEAFSLRYLDKKNFVIVGNSDWGTEYGVYDFLERFLNIVWLMPSDLGVDVPKYSDLMLNHAEINEEPSFLTRYFSPFDIDFPNDINSKWGRINRIRRNIEYGHNMINLFSVDKYKKKNANFYPQSNGRREIPSERDYDWQPNFSAEGIADTATQSILNYFLRRPNVTSFSLGINDSKNFDRSSKSLERRNGRVNILGYEDVSNDYFLWANEVVKNVTSVYPDKLFGTLAYNNLFSPPTNNMKINSNIVPFITYERSRWADNSARALDQLNTKNWLKYSDKVGWYDYVYGLSYIAPRVWPHTMKEYLSWAYTNGVRYYIAEFYPNWGEGPKGWVLSKLLWDPSQNIDDLLDFWYTRFAGSESAPYLSAYFDLWEKFWTKDVHRSKWFNTNSQYLLFFSVEYAQIIPKDYLTRSDLYLRQSLKATKTDQQRKRVSELIRMWEIYKLAIEETQKEKIVPMVYLKKSTGLVRIIRELSHNPLHTKSSEMLLKYINP